MDETSKANRAAPWNKGKLVGQKSPFKRKEIWAIRVRPQLEKRIRELALFDLVIDSKLRACDLVKLRVRDICLGDRVASRTIVMQQKTGCPVQFEITEPTREAASSWIKKRAEIGRLPFSEPNSRVAPPWYSAIRANSPFLG